MIAARPHRKEVAESFYSAPPLHRTLVKKKKKKKTQPSKSFVPEREERKIINAILNIKPEEVFAMFPKMGYTGSSNPARARNNYDVTNIALLCGLDVCCQQLRARCIVRIPLVTGDSPGRRFLSFRLWRYSIIVFIPLPANLKSHRAMAEGNATRCCRNEEEHGKMSGGRIVMVSNKWKIIRGIPGWIIRKDNNKSWK